MPPVAVPWCRSTRPAGRRSGCGLRAHWPAPTRLTRSPLRPDPRGRRCSYPSVGPPVARDRASRHPWPNAPAHRCESSTRCTASAPGATPSRNAIRCRRSRRSARGASRRTRCLLPSACDRRTPAAFRCRSWPPRSRCRFSRFS